MHNACTPLNSMSFLMITHCLNQLRSIDCLNQCLRARLIQWTKLCSPAAAYGWWLPQLMPIHFERGWFPYDAQEWENLEMRGWGRCLRKTKLHFVRKDNFIDIDFGEQKRLSWYSGRFLLLANISDGKWYGKQSIRETKWLMQYLWFGFAFEEVLSFWFLW